mmetsp:Transcript_823/g.3211  ORF Transcript_823/g.3211 Transcript_823/m.3211 type:complete len:276 (-) Transcript_823:325-1152(-)
MRSRRSVGHPSASASMPKTPKSACMLRSSSTSAPQFRATRRSASSSSESHPPSNSEFSFDAHGALSTNASMPCLEMAVPLTSMRTRLTHFAAIRANTSSFTAALLLKPSSSREEKTLAEAPPGFATPRAASAPSSASVAGPSASAAEGAKTFSVRHGTTKSTGAPRFSRRRRAHPSTARATSPKSSPRRTLPRLTCVEARFSAVSESRAPRSRAMSARGDQLEPLMSSSRSRPNGRGLSGLSSSARSRAPCRSRRWRQSARLSPPASARLSSTTP